MSSINDLTIQYEEDGIVVVKELDKHILSKGAWSTIMFKYCDWDKAKQTYGAPKYAIRRYQKRGDAYLTKSKFTISSDDQARKIIEVLSQWIPQSEP